MVYFSQPGTVVALATMLICMLAVLGTATLVIILSRIG